MYGLILIKSSGNIFLMIGRVLILFTGSYLIVPSFLVEPILSHLLFVTLFYLFCDHNVGSIIHCLALIVHSYLHHFYSSKPTTIAFELTADEYFHLFYIPIMIHNLDGISTKMKRFITVTNVIFNLLVIITKQITFFYITFGMGSLFIWLPLWIRDGMSFDILPINMFLVHSIFSILIATTPLPPKLYVSIATCSFYSECLGHHVKQSNLNSLNHYIDGGLKSKNKFMRIISYVLIVVLSVMITKSLIDINKHLLVRSSIEI